MSMKTLNALFKEMSEVESRKIALVVGNEKYSYLDLDKAADLFASDLIDRGIQPGDHVGIWSFNSANWLIAMLGIIRAGGVAILGNYSMTYPDIRDLFVMNCMLLRGAVDSPEKVHRFLDFALDAR